MRLISCDCAVSVGLQWTLLDTGGWQRQTEERDRQSSVECRHGSTHSHPVSFVAAETSHPSCMVGCRLSSHSPAAAVFCCCCSRWLVDLAPKRDVPRGRIFKPLDLHDHDVSAIGNSTTGISSTLVFLTVTASFQVLLLSSHPSPGQADPRRPRPIRRLRSDRAAHCRSPTQPPLRSGSTACSIATLSSTHRHATRHVGQDSREATSAQRSRAD